VVGLRGIGRHHLRCSAAEQGMQVVRIMEAIYESAASGELVKL